MNYCQQSEYIYSVLISFSSELLTFLLQGRTHHTLITYLIYLSFPKKECFGIVCEYVCTIGAFPNLIKNRLRGFLKSIF